MSGSMPPRVNALSALAQPIVVRSAPNVPGTSPPASRVAHSAHPQSMVKQPHGAPMPSPMGLPAIIVRVGPPGGDAAQAHLHAGHSPDALVEAAANSLAQAAMVHGRLDPARYVQWVQQRVQFLSHILDAAALFGTLEAAQRTIQAVTAQSGAGGVGRS